MMFRGRSISSGRPAATLSFSYDHRDGLYAGLSASALLARGDSAHLFAIEESGGYAQRLSPSLSLDVGIINTHYSRYWSGGRAAGYTEVHLGLDTRRLKGQISFSPNYLAGGWRTIYGMLDYQIVSSARWNIGVHGGTLLWIAGGRPRGARLAHYDWQISAARQIGAVQLGVAWASGGPQADRYGGRPRPHGAPVISLSAAF
jgi:uncharacterized protein (TIGR02001 family)